MPRAADLDAVTVDAYGTLVELADPRPALLAVLAERGVERDAEAVAAAFAAEVAYYKPRSLRGRDEESLAELRRECAQVFLRHLEAELDEAEFAPAFVGALVFRVVDGAAQALDRLAAAGLRLACVANWDMALSGHLQGLGLAERFEAIVASAEAGVEKPDPRIFRLALERLGVAPERALHVGDEENDREGARRAGLAFEPTPLETLPARLGL